MNLLVQITDIFIQSVSEADIDWIICTELNSCKEFRVWLSSLIFPHYTLINHTKAYRSVSNVLGESDLVWAIKDPEGKQHLALIENKINAPAQPEQFERYAQRGIAYVNQGICIDFTTVLLAPQAYYSQDSQRYDIRINYSTLKDWFNQRKCDRSTYFASLFEIASTKRNSNAIPDLQTTRYRQRVWELAQAEFPELRMLPPGDVSASQYWVDLSYPDFSITYKIFRKANKFGDCVVDLQLAGRGNDIEILKKQYTQALEGTGISIIQTGKSASFRLEVPPVSPIDFNDENIRIALHSASKLLNWWREANS